VIAASNLFGDLLTDLGGQLAGGLGVLSAALMLDHLEEFAAAERIRAAVGRTLAAGHATPDLGGRLTTRQMGAELVRNL
jgi:isocitrate/isopropylmalate dehydrogenase